jgi:hypothetical protein
MDSYANVYTTMDILLDVQNLVERVLIIHMVLYFKQIMYLFVIAHMNLTEHL